MSSSAAARMTELRARVSALAAQCARFFETARAGHWWGTILSEPGSGGDPGRTRTRAVETEAGWSLFGEKHFGSGAGVTSFMIATALADGASFARSQTFGQWSQDVRALGFLRPPWGFAFDRLLALDFAAT